MKRVLSAGSMIWGAAAGAFAMFLLDPDQGRRRRAALREGARRTRLRLSERLKTFGQELRGELSGLKGALPGRRTPNEEPLS